ncbi:GSCOCG00001429001-RA-CDS [Cotesia congregata]|nr:GSCOCG00001429001-RA-CDS [Cotesia congregata]
MDLKIFITAKIFIRSLHIINYYLVYDKLIN